MESVMQHAIRHVPVTTPPARVGENTTSKAATAVPGDHSRLRGESSIGPDGSDPARGPPGSRGENKNTMLTSSSTG